MADLSERWRRARRAALAAEAADLEAHAPRATGDQEPSTQRRVFDNSLRLGDGFRRFHATSLDLGALPATLAHLAAGAPCLRGTWRHANGEDAGGASILDREGCEQRDEGAAACDRWREAISGLVLGLSDGAVRHARHDSQGHGGRRCVDVLHVDPQSSLRFGSIPDDMRPALAEVTRMLAAFDTTLSVEFLGLSEGTLYYQIPAAGCGSPGGVRAQPLIERGVRRRFPHVTVFEVTPRPVITDGP